MKPPFFNISMLPGLRERRTGSGFEYNCDPNDRSELPYPDHHLLLFLLVGTGVTDRVGNLALCDAYTGHHGLEVRTLFRRYFSRVSNIRNYQCVNTLNGETKWTGPAVPREPTASISTCCV